MNVISALKADRHNIVDQLFEKIQTYKDEKHTYYLILDVKNLMANNTVNTFVEIDEQLKDLNGTFIKIFSLSLETNYGDYTKDRLYTIFDKKLTHLKLTSQRQLKNKSSSKKTTNAISLTCLITTKQNIS